MKNKASGQLAACSSVAITGRFQPFHRDHLDLVRHGLSLAPRVVVGITNPDARSWQAVAASGHRHLATSNPFSYLERLRMITAALACAGIPANRYDIVPFPLDCPGVWTSYIPRDVAHLVRVFSEWEAEKTRRLEAGGYPVKVLFGDPATRISASEIRAAMAAGHPWDHWVPPGAREQLATLGVRSAE